MLLENIQEVDCHVLHWGSFVGKLDVLLDQMGNLHIKRFELLFYILKRKYIIVDLDGQLVLELGHLLEDLVQFNNQEFSDTQCRILYILLLFLHHLLLHSGPPSW